MDIARKPYEISLWEDVLTFVVQRADGMKIEYEERIPSDATGRVMVDINGVGYYADIVNGKAKVIVPELPSGKYTAKVTYE